MVVVNPGSSPRSGVVFCEDRLHYVSDVPALGAAVVDRATPAPVAPVRVDGRTIANGLIEATLDATGRVATLRRVGGPNACRAPMNQLVLYEDRPRAWEAWDIDAEHVEKPRWVDDPPERLEIVERDPLRGAIAVERPLGAHSRITQRYVLAAGSPRLDVVTRVDWWERRRFLRALFPTDVRARRATYEIQFGHLERPTHRNTSWEQAQFEVCAHAWADLSAPGLGLTVLNDGKYGHSCEEHVLGLSLLRGPCFPDPDADAGVHEFTYSLMVHDGDWRDAGVDREAHALNDPLLARPAPPGRTGPLGPRWAPFTLAGDAAAGIVVSAIKPAEDGARRVVRLVETHGRRGTLEIAWGWPVADLASVDLLERPRAHRGMTHDHEKGRTTIAVRPFEIVTLAVETASG